MNTDNLSCHEFDRERVRHLQSLGMPMSEAKRMSALEVMRGRIDAATDLDALKDVLNDLARHVYGWG